MSIEEEFEGHDPRIAQIHGNRLKDSGWYGIVTRPGWDQIIIDLDAELQEVAPDYKLLQCKQKFGGLRYYIEGTNEEAEKAIARASKRATQTCEYCGGPGDLRKLNSWLVTLCDEHNREARELRKLPPEDEVYDRKV